jgi:hypothetical protein
MVSVSDRYNRHVCTALTDAFIRTDAELAGTEVGELVGTTAVVAVVGARELYIASVGKLSRCHNNSNKGATGTRGSDHEMAGQHICIQFAVIFESLTCIPGSA